MEIVVGWPKQRHEGTVVLDPSSHQRKEVCAAEISGAQAPYSPPLRVRAHLRIGLDDVQGSLMERAYSVFWEIPAVVPCVPSYPMGRSFFQILLKVKQSPPCL